MALNLQKSSSAHILQKTRALQLIFRGVDGCSQLPENDGVSLFKEELTAWFDVHFLTNPSDEERQDIQVDGLRESTLYILDILRGEIELAGKPKNVVLGGVSQGMAAALWALLCSPGKGVKGKIDGIDAFFGMCGWLPFANKIEDFLQKVPDDTTTRRKLGLMIPKLLRDIIGWEQTQTNIADIERVLSTRTLLLHGTDDAWIDVELGRQAHRNLTEMGMRVDWVEYSGAENEGHWVKEPECIDTIVAFIQASISFMQMKQEEEIAR